MAKKTTGRAKTIAKQPQAISASLIDAVCQRLAANQRVRRTLPGKGRLHIDRQLPFLCVYRQPANTEDAGTERLVKGEASYLMAPGATTFHGDVSNLVGRIAQTLSAEFGAFLIIEIWSALEGGKANDPAIPSVSPRITIHGPERVAITPTVEALEKRLKRFRVLKQAVEVSVVRDDSGHPPDMRPLLTEAEADEWNCSIIGVSMPPVYRKPNSTEEFPLLVRALRRSLSLALRQTYFEFARSRTTHRPPHYHSLGRRAVVNAVWDIDRRLASVSSQFDYLLLLTPVNSNSAWRQFERERFERVPEFHYRPLPIDPGMLKRELYRIPIERVEDPALQRLFHQKQEELELKLTMLRDRDTSRFLHESLQLFGGVRAQLLRLATDLLDQLPQTQLPQSQLPDEGGEERGATITAEDFARLAESEIDFYQQSSPAFTAKAVVAADVSGLIVSRGNLLINSDLALSPLRVEALLAHEVGTHLLTYYNGRQQPFQQLCSGLAGYEELQEGLAVLSEYLVGGLSRSRMRQLAGRVVAVRHLTEGASFVETFRTLERDYNFTHRTSYNITMRVFRGGGLTKDAVYLRGLAAILQYVQKGGDLHPLLVGKMAIEHIPIIKELQYRNVLNPAPVIPRYLRDDASVARLERLRGSNGSLADLVESQ